MKYVLAMLIVALNLTLGFLYSQDVAAWDPPEECADEDREIEGNRNSPCKVVVPEISHVEYRVRMVYPQCVEEMLVHMPGSVAPSGRPPQITIRADTTHYIWNNDSVHVITIKDGHVQVTGRRWGVTSAINRSSFENIGSQLRVGIPTLPNGWLIYSNWVERPRTDAVVELVNACLSQVREETAQREAEAQAFVAAQELAAAQESRRRIAAAELIKTEALQTQIAHEEVIAEILRDIVRIRLAGQEDRARLTSEYLTRAESAAVDFEEETSDIEARIQDYLDFNAELLTRLEDYQADISARLERVQASIDEQQASIDVLEEEAQRLSTEDGTPGPTPESSEGDS